MSGVDVRVQRGQFEVHGTYTRSGSKPCAMNNSGMSESRRQLMGQAMGKTRRGLASAKATDFLIFLYHRLSECGVHHLY